VLPVPARLSYYPFTVYYPGGNGMAQFLPDRKAFGLNVMVQKAV
jgi:hypothetical protein